MDSTETNEFFGYRFDTIRDQKLPLVSQMRTRPCCLETRTDARREMSRFCVDRDPKRRMQNMKAIIHHRANECHGSRDSLLSLGRLDY